MQWLCISEMAYNMFSVEGWKRFIIQILDHSKDFRYILVYEKEKTFSGYFDVVAIFQTCTKEF